MIPAEDPRSVPIVIAVDGCVFEMRVKQTHSPAPAHLRRRQREQRQRRQTTHVTGGSEVNALAAELRRRREVKAVQRPSDRWPTSNLLLVTHARRVVPTATVFNAPIATGVWFDMHPAVGQGFEAWFRAVDDLLRDTPWNVVAPKVRQDKLKFGVDDRAGAGRLAWIAEVDAPEPLREMVRQQIPHLTLEAATMRVFDFGTAATTWVFSNREQEPESYAAALAGIEMAEATLHGIVSEWIHESLAELARAVSGMGTVVRQHPDEGVDADEFGIPCWWHKVLVARRVPGDDQTVTSPEHHCFVDGTHLVCWDGCEGSLWAGHGTSVLETSARATGLTEAVSSALELANAYFLGAQEMGGRVLRRQQELASLRRQRDADRLEDEALSIVELQDDLALFRMLLRDQLIKQPHTKLRMFEAFAESWRFESLMLEIEQQRSDLADVHDQSVRSLQAHEAAKLNGVVLVLTLISAIQVMTDMVIFTQLDELRAPVLIPTATVSVLSLLMIVYVVAAGLGPTLRRMTRSRTVPKRVGASLAFIETDRDDS